MTTQNRQPVLHYILSSATHPEYGRITIPFPIPVIEYGCTPECLAAMELGARLKWDCRVGKLESGFPISKRLEKVGANLDELDYLARWLDSFGDYEAVQFQAIAVRLDTFDITNFIGLTFCCQQATVITNFSDLGGIGKTHILTISSGCLYVDEQEQVDGKAEVLKLVLNEHDTITPCEAVYDDGMELERLYTESGPFPDYPDREFVILLEASSDEGQSTLLILPNGPTRLERPLCRTGMRNNPQIHSRVADSTLPDKVTHSIPAERLSINSLNRLYQAAEWIAPGDLRTPIQLLTDRDQPSQGPSLGGLSMRTGGREYVESRIHPADQ